MKLGPRLLLGSLLFAGLTLAGHAATANSTTSNIFSDETVFANSIYDSAFKYSGAVDGIATAYNGTNSGVYASEFVFADHATGPDLLSISGFDASAGIDSITFFGTGEYGSDRAANSVIIYTSTTDYTNSTDALTLSNYTALNGGTPFILPTNSNSSDFSEGVDSAGSTQGFDTLTGLDIPLGTESILFSFTRPSTAGTGFSEIQGFAVPEPATYAMMLAGLALLGLCVRRKVA